METYLIIFLVSYFIGAIPFFFIYNWHKGNLAKACVFFLDLYKAYITTYLFGIVSYDCLLLCILAINLGHIYPLPYKPSSPQSMGTALGCLVIVWPYAILLYFMTYSMVYLQFKKSAGIIALYASLLGLLLISNVYLTIKLTVLSICIITSFKSIVNFIKTIAY